MRIGWLVREAVRRGRDRSGQAMAEYVIVMAMAVGARWFERLAELVAAQPIAAAGIAVAVVLFALVAVRR